MWMEGCLELENEIWTWVWVSDEVSDGVSVEVKM